MGLCPLTPEPGSPGQKTQAHLGQSVVADYYYETNVLKTLRLYNVVIVQRSFGHCCRTNVLEALMFCNIFIVQRSFGCCCRPVISAEPGYFEYLH
jgi:hypothetical protein